MFEPSDVEQYMLEMINAERARAGVPAVVFDPNLNRSAERHSRWMAKSGAFSHTGDGGSSHTARMQQANWRPEGAWKAAENIGWTSLRDGPPTVEVEALHKDLVNSPGHRANILDAEFRQVGIGLESGDHQGRPGAFVTQNFARSGDDVFLTGVVFADRDRDRAYDPGEGLGGISVKATSRSGEVHAATTYASGGYSLRLPPGAYEVTFSGAASTSPRSVVIGRQNVKLDQIVPMGVRTASTRQRTVR